MLGHEPTAIPVFSAKPCEQISLRLQNEWEMVQASHDRDAVYDYLTAGFELVSWWAQEGRAVNHACRALHLRKNNSVEREPEPFATVIYCTADRGKVIDDRTRSKWSRACGLRGRIQGPG